MCEATPFPLLSPACCTRFLGFLGALVLPFPSAIVPSPPPFVHPPRRTLSKPSSEAFSMTLTCSTRKVSLGLPHELHDWARLVVILRPTAPAEAAACLDLDTTAPLPVFHAVRAAYHAHVQ